MQARRRPKTALKNTGEAKLQNLWGAIDTDREYLTADKRRLKIIFPGAHNNEAGPDFLNAKIQMENKIRIGDIEIHIKSSDWNHHSHNNNPAYDNVILHVVEKDDAIENKPDIPVFLIADAVRKTRAQNNPCPFFAHADESGKTGKLLEEAGIEKFKEKTSSMLLEMLKTGAEKTFLKQIFRAIGYKKNSENFTELSGRLFNYDLRELKKDDAVKAVLWGESGLLPESKKYDLTPEISEFLENIWNKWWKIRKSATPEIKWERTGTRPLNSPERRLAALCLLLKKTDCAPLNFFYSNVENSGRPEKLWQTLKKILICSDPLWDNYSNFTAKRKDPAAVLGENRALELAVNAILPGLTAYAKLKEDAHTEKFIEKAWLFLPPTQDNKLVKSALKMWFQDKSVDRKKLLDSSAKIQGTMRIYNEFCRKSSSDCKACPVYNSSGLS